MIAPLAKFIDWSALQMAYALVGLNHAPKPKWKLEEALEFLNGSDFIPSTSNPVRIEFDGPRHVSALFVPGLMGRVLRWLTPKLEASQQNNV
jgi:hypothetical protein